MTATMIREEFPGERRPDFQDEVKPLLGDLHRRAYAYVRDTSDAEDLVQETLLRAYRAFDRLGDDYQLMPWLLAIMRNTWISRYRAAQRRPAEALVGEFLDTYAETASRGASGETWSAEDVAMRNMSDPAVVAALSKLPESLRLTMYYTAIVGMSCREVSTLMDIPKGTVMSRLHRGRHQMRRALSHHRS
ncbi:sigma-70 family RNA polymerase sigma factor [Mycolicibacterium smegmatis]|jgi:RNA polymerase sigma-70 factor (ECF subfamily)|uniref:RNA polymerase sigma factor n=5 Tax=Bacteria TaxID=2 RepID=I7FLR9_MYCS2|nr:sigma-70 family RNA polymerase sigma factor [Mycolicibacterium smegmatis]AFP39673.1 RNA polymerase sigma-70 factor, ECF subfamily [Mycolicibacterium smegmatis MC2 155]MCC3338396.1 sigma-70 family RNA polymerase sigma factor [Mycolicibacterium smegmatis]MCO4192591.1 sigma-70 family RNA polymerase sigma factor [Mycolicibacterium smegmatis]UUR99385.1 sigma-70 family RNA polymerase sigma factor [Mycolicibacterium smegmatis]UUS05940.1 sigma-70 family RNA polymerase sigma factor [Mycolicibacteriu